MTDMEIMQILASDMDIFEKGKAFRNALNAAKPSALNITAQKPRAKRGPNKAKGGLVQTETGLVQNGLDHEAH